MNHQVIVGDCLDKMKDLPPDSVDSIITDPPYGLGFMGKEWDHGIPGKDFWVEALRVAKPGAHLLAFGGTRTYHRLACAIEDAGWEIRDCIMWVYGSGFPKSMDISKAFDKAAGAEREVVSTRKLTGTARIKGQAAFEAATGRSEEAYLDGSEINYTYEITAPATEDAKRWSGWGTALKPAWEPIIVARKPLTGTVIENVKQYGTGGINVDGCRVGTDKILINTWDDGSKPFGGGAGHPYTGKVVEGRWPANLIHDGSEEVEEGFPKNKSGVCVQRNGGGQRIGGVNSEIYSGSNGMFREDVGYRDAGSVSRFFYCAKANKEDREEGLDGFKDGTKRILNGGIPSAVNSDPVGMSGGGDRPAKNFHPTVKPVELMKYLCRLVTPPKGVVLDPFMGSGSTGKGAMLEGFDFIGIEMNPDYAKIAEARIEAAKKANQPKSNLVDLFE